MKTPLEVIREGEREFEQNYKQEPDDVGYFGWKTEVDYLEVTSVYKAQTLALLQALRAELDNTLPEYWLNDESVPFHCDHNKTIKDCRKVIDNLDALIKELTT